MHAALGIYLKNRWKAGAVFSPAISDHWKISVLIPWFCLVLKLSPWEPHPRHVLWLPLLIHMHCCQLPSCV